MKTAVRGCSQLATMAGSRYPRTGPEMRELSILEDGAFVFEDGAITWVGSSSDLPTDVEDIVEADGRLATPGLIDAHTHAVFGGHRANEFEMRCLGANYHDIKAVGGGIWSSVKATRRAEEEDLIELGNEKLQWMLRCGTTTVEVKSGYGLDTATEVKMLKVARQLEPQRVVTTFLGAHSIPPEAPSKRDYIELIVREMLPQAAKFAEFCDIFVEYDYFDHGDATEILEAARQYQLGLKLHVDQFSNSGGAKLAAKLEAWTADHLEQTDQEGIQALKEAQVIPVLLPASVYCLGLDKYPDAMSMISEGLPVVLATDFNPGSSPSPSLLFAMSLACTQMKMTAAEALTACTINAAHAVKRSHEVGSIETGKRADFVIWNASDYRELPYWVGREMAGQVFIDGKKVL